LYEFLFPVCATYSVLSYLLDLNALTILCEVINHKFPYYIIYSISCFTALGSEYFPYHFSFSNAFNYVLPSE
jgi:hypothetical protein